ncbi:MAG: peroxiredoxin [Candidatus Methylacidiphilales bacterium]
MIRQAFLSLLAFTAVASASELKLGDKIPALTLPDQDGKPLDLPAYGSEGYLLVFFYPKANTPGCTAQACSLRDAETQLKERGVKILGISADKPDSQKKFVNEQNLPYPLIADAESKAIQAFGVEGPMFGFARRSAFLFHNGKLVWRDAKASTKDQAEIVLKALDTLSPAKK